MDVEYVPEPKFVNLLKRLEQRRDRQAGRSTSAKSNSSSSKVTHEPTPEEYERYQIMIRTAAARRPELRAASPHNQGFIRPASSQPRDDFDPRHFTGPDIDVRPLPLTSPLHAVAENAMHHNTAVEKFSEREGRIDDYLNRQFPAEFFETTAERDALRSQMQTVAADATSTVPSSEVEAAQLLSGKPSDSLHSNLNRIESVLGLGKKSKTDGTVGVQPVGNTEDVPPDTTAANATPSTEAVTSGKMKKVINKVRIVRALDGGTSHHIEPQEIAALRAKLHDALQTIEAMKVDHEREKAQTALQTELRTMALKAEAEQRAEDLEQVIKALKTEIDGLHQELEAARKQADDLRPLQGEVARLQAQVLKEQELRRAAEIETAKAQNQLAKIPDMVAVGVRAAEAERLGAEARCLAAIAESTKLTSELRAAHRETESLKLQLADVHDLLQQERDNVAALEKRITEAAAAYNDLKCELDALEKSKANFEASAAARVEEEMSQLTAESQRRGEAVAKLTAEKTLLEAEVARLQEIADLYDTQRKTMKKMNRELSGAQDQLAQLRAGYANAMARRMHHIFTNIALKLHLARVLRPDGLADRLRQTEEQNKWLFEKLAHATAMAKRRLHPHKGPKTRRIARAEGEEATHDDHHHDQDDGQKTPRDGHHWIWVFDSSTQTTTSAFDGAFNANATMYGSVSHAASMQVVPVPSYTSLSSSQPLSAATGGGSQAARVRELADTSHRLNPVSDRSTSPTSVRNLYDAPLPTVVTEGSDLLTIDSNTYHQLPPRAGSAASTRSAGARQGTSTTPLPGQAIPKRAASAGSVASSASRRPRPSSALSLASSSAIPILAPDPHPQQPGVPNLLVQGTPGPQGAILSASPYNYFGTQLDERDRRSGSAAMSNPRAGSQARHGEQQVVVAPDWMPTSYATTTVRSTVVVNRSSQPRDVRSPTIDESSLQRSDDVAAAQSFAPVTELGSVLPSSHLPGGAWKAMRR